MAYTLRVSVLDACQLRCRYCLPHGAVSTMAKATWLTIEQYEKIACALKPLGIEKIRFTGGEPLLRSDLPQITQVFAQTYPGIELAITTNGLRFSLMKADLIKAGLTAATFHLDTLKAERYPTVMGRGDIAVVHQAVLLALESGLRVKINMVVQHGVNDDEIIDFLLYSQTVGVEVRFIELMNTGSAKDYVQKTFMSGQQIVALIERHTKVIPVARAQKSAPAEQFLAPDLGITFGLIASDTRPFCADCNRLRLSANGFLRTCLYEPVGHKLATINEDALLSNIERIVAEKTSFHPNLKKDRQNFSMSHVGG
jgi:GTP 3',8-cyclase